MIPNVHFPVPASQKVRTISRRYCDGWALRCRCAQHVVPPRGAALAAVACRGPGGMRRAHPRLGQRASGGKAQTQGAGRGSSPLFRNALREYKMPLAFCLFEVRLSEIKFEARRPECARFCQANWPRQARDGAGPRSARTDSPMPAALSFFRCTALRAPCFHFLHTARLLVLCCLSGF